MAEVFLAKAAGPMGFEKTLVLKRILPQLAQEPAFVQMFLSEAKLAARLTHPHIAQIFDFGEADGAYFLAMEYIDGPSLRALIKRAAAQGLALPPAICARLIADACEGLAFAHDFADPDTGEPLGLIHRDISPDNILLSRQGAVKVVDFGIAKAAGQAHKTESGVIKGKLAYMPSEQIRARELDRRVDVYALGVVLYELLTGQRPFISDTDAGLMQAILYEQPIPAARLRPDLPQPLRRILGKALAREREQRYPDCHDLQAELESFIVSAGKPVTTQQVAQLIRATSDTPMPALTPAPVPTDSAPPNLARRRPSSSTNEALTANVRPSPRSREIPNTLVTPLPRTAELEPTRPSRPTLPPVPESSPDMDGQAPRPMTETARQTAVPPRPSGAAAAVRRPVMSAEKPRSSNRWGPALLGGVLLATCGGVAFWRMKSQPEVQGSAPIPRSAPEPQVAAPPAPLPQPPPKADEPTPGAETPAPGEPPVADSEPAGPVEHKSFASVAPLVELRVRPYATVFVDGKRLGVTPLRGLKLSPGRHTLKLVNDEIRRTKEIILDVKAGANSSLGINLLEE
ncbi:protein kinase [Cystobacter fuscus]|uniref:serine/threonine protein kinase n=1 Tax=Cystobacter fuscus TaxID=43 RepID=UPI0037BF792C